MNFFFFNIAIVLLLGCGINLSPQSKSSSDHGLAMGNHGLMGKQNMYDHSMRVPLFVVGTDVPKNEKTLPGSIVIEENKQTLVSFYPVRW